MTIGLRSSLRWPRFFLSPQRYIWTFFLGLSLRCFHVQCVIFSHRKKNLNRSNLNFHFHNLGTFSGTSSSPSLSSSSSSSYFLCWEDGDDETTNNNNNICISTIYQSYYDRFSFSFLFLNFPYLPLPLITFTYG